MNVGRAAMRNYYGCGFVALFFVLSGCSGAESLGPQYTNSIGMSMVRIESGSFSMGRDKGGDWDERPAHPVQIGKAFYMGVTEVTNVQYEEFDPDHRKLRGKYGFAKNDNEAVVYVSWHEAMAFCEWLSKKEGKSYRLPTEAQWEYACRAGTTTAFYTGDLLPTEYHKHQKTEWRPRPVSLEVGKTPANPWGLFDMHGNVEEWCYDWYGSYVEGEQIDPIGYAQGDFKVTRGGSHSTPVTFLRSANRAGTLPEDKHWLIGFRVVMGDLPKTKLFPKPKPQLWAQSVNQSRHDWKDGSDITKPFFLGPQTYVKIPPKSNGPMFSEHNHCPALEACPNGDLLAIWYTCNDEPGRELAIVASRLRKGSKQWEPAAPFWDGPDRNDHGSALLWDRKETMYFINGLSTDATWGKLALVMRTSKDNGATWSKARLIDPEHRMRNQVIAGTFITKEGYIIQQCDAVTGGRGGTAVNISRDGGKTWVDPGEGKKMPEFKAGSSGAWIAGIHAGVAQLTNGNLLAYGRGNNINGRMPKSISSDMGQTWMYSASEFDPLGGGQRLVLRRLQEGPLFFASFAKKLKLKDAAGKERQVKGLFGALSYDDGKTWPVKKLISDFGPARRIDGGGNTGFFTLSANAAEPKGYMACTQTPDSMIHLISSKQYYKFNVAWLMEPIPPEKE